jgi:hypothetical protein
MTLRNWGEKQRVTQRANSKLLAVRFLDESAMLASHRIVF